MRLIFMTQKIDREDSILGFTCEWIDEFANTFKKITVIGQYVKEGEKLNNQSIEIYSLGKEKGKSKLIQIIRYWKILWEKSGEYDAIFIHMTPIWAIVAFPISLIMKKPIILWYEARGTGWNIRLAKYCVQSILSASTGGLKIESEKNKVIGHGINTKLFQKKENIQKDPYHLIAIGRITNAKQIPLLIHTLIQLPEQYHLSIIGRIVTKKDSIELQKIEEFIEEKKIKHRIQIRSVTHEELPNILSSATLCIHASMTSLDKAILEAMSCETLVVSCAPAIQRDIPEYCQSSKEGFLAKVKEMLNLKQENQEEIGRKLRKFVIQNHSMETLAKRIKNQIKL